MPGGAFFAVQKGKFLAMIDQGLRVPSQDMIEALESRKSLLEIGKDTKILQDRDRHHVEEEVLGDTGAAWWASFANKEAIVRAGYIEAIRLSLAQPKPLPIVSYWVAGGANFEISLLQNEREIILLLLTPTPPPLPENVPASAAVDEKIWAIASDERASEIVGAYPPSWEIQKENVEAYGLGAVKKVRTKGL